MRQTWRLVSRTTMVLIVVFTFFFLLLEGYSYYRLGIEDRFYHAQHQLLKPSGLLGHGLGIIGSSLIVIGVCMYMIRKRVRRFSRIGVLKYWLEFHIFLCSLGPVLVLFHTAFKFGGIVSVSFWCMVAVVVSGIIGRYIYLQIPHTIEGREMSLAELEMKKAHFKVLLQEKYQLNSPLADEILQAVKARPSRPGGESISRFVEKLLFQHKLLQRVRMLLRTNHFEPQTRKELLRLIRYEISLNRKIDRLVTMQNLFRYWHVAHLPFALVMLLIMLIHIGVALAFGYRWIF
ncbi:hypothetical protein [Mangrovibacterium diazotrophicum]|uniref:Ferric reductase like protein n=1 Tax=Mangrovibacterium diazotrophicum TaxID=1261403 RepID=A0A419W2P0_9BACT|nr:hypothetical protein [Mangrovibacterium diazotrophicum]RKD89756.1 hypothetical protein BC643_0088 [Mangrovibacterium diazotrophicum]